MSQQVEPGHKPRYRRLLIGFNHHMECRSVLDFAAQVCQAAEVELAGVFVEDQELFDLARLPFSTEILSSSGVIRNLESKSVETELRAVATVMRNALRKLAGQARRQYSFRTVRGHMWRELIALAGAGDLILLRATCAPWRAAKPAMPAMNGPVVLLESPGGGNGNLVALAREIARMLNQELVIAHTYDGPPGLRELKAGLIIISGPISGMDAWNKEIESFIDTLFCPVLMVPKGG